MDTGTTVKLDEDVLIRLRHESQIRGTPVRQTLNDLLRAALPAVTEKPPRRTLTITPMHMGRRPGLNYDCIESLLKYGEGELHR